MLYSHSTTYFAPFRRRRQRPAATPINWPNVGLALAALISWAAVVFLFANVAADALGLGQL